MSRPQSFNQSATSFTYDLSDSNLGDDAENEKFSIEVVASMRLRNVHPIQEEASEELVSLTTLPGMSGELRPSFRKEESSRGSRRDKHSRTLDSSLSSQGKVSRKLTDFRMCCGSIVNNVSFQIAVVTLIMINAIELGVATLDCVSENPPLKRAFDIADTAFLAFFTIELTIQFIYIGLRTFTDRWLIFDVIIISLSWALDSVQVFRALRVFRIFGLVSRIPGLRRLLNAIMLVLPGMYSIALLMLIIMYIYAVLCTTLLGNLYEMGATQFDYFSRLDYSLFTLFQIMTLDWTSVARETMAVYPWAGTIFVSFIVISNFIIYNLIIAVVCDTVHLVESMKVEEMQEYEEDIRSGEFLGSQELDKRRIQKIQSRLSQMIDAQNLVLDYAKNAVQELESDMGFRKGVSSKSLYKGVLKGFEEKDEARQTGLENVRRKSL